MPKGLDALDVIQIVLVIMLAFMIANYMYTKWTMKANRLLELDDVENFANPEGPDGDTIILGNEQLYDEFYSKIYDQITDAAGRQDAETTMTLGWAKSYRPDVSSILVLDIGSGTGDNVDLFKKAGVGKVVGLDASEAMVARARKKHPKNDYRVGEAESISLFAAGEFNLVTLYYFTYYYLRDPDMMFRNAFNWLQPGGCLVIHLVNRTKFDPILEAASPFTAFSVQKYSKKRVTKSKVSFDKFTYEADFQLSGDRAEFREDFKFKNGKHRKQTHYFHMANMESIVQRAEQNGFKYEKFIDLTVAGYEYQYLFCFIR